MRHAEYTLYPDAHDTLDALRRAGVKLALVTNGRGELQRAKIARFDLAHRFDHIQIEGEFGRGKPEPDVYHHALGKLGCAAAEAWMVGDNIEWEVVTPQRLGLRGIWYDPDGDGLPTGSAAQPDRIIGRLADLLLDEAGPNA
jgi:putative hydrolase of the HAD superfamily